MSNPRKNARHAAIGIAGLAVVLGAVALGRFRDGAPATPTKPTRTPEAAAARPLRVESLKSTEAPRPLPVARRTDPAAAPMSISKSVEPLIDSPEAHLLLSTEQRAPREKSGLALPDRLEILKERDGLVGYSTATYGATIGRGHVDLALSRQIRDLGQARLAYDLVDVRYGSTVLATGGDAAARVSAEDRTVTFARGPVEERYFLRADALEQSFIIRSLPSGRGDLTVTGRVSSNLAPPMAGSAAKLSFTAQGKDVLTVSEAVAIDATGRRRELDLAYADGKLSITVPADWLAGATAPIVIDPLMGTALTVDSSLTEVVGTVQGVAVRVVDAAYNAASNEWLVVWQEQFGGSAYNFDIYAQRFSAAGVPVGALIPVAVSGAGEYEPSVSWASSVNKYLIAWRHDPADDASDADQFIAGRLFSWDGVAAGSAFTLDDAAGQDFGPSLAFDGTNWLCVYTNVLSATNTNVLGRFVAADGTPGLAVSVDTDADLAASPSVDFTGTTYLIAWQKGVSGSPRSIYARTMNAGGTFLLAAKAVDTSATDCVHPDVCAGGGQFLIVWQQAATAPDNNVVGRLASTSLTFAKNPFNVRATVNDQLTPRSAFSVSSALWYVVYSDTTTGARDIYGTRVDTTGKVTGANKLSSDVAAEVKPEIAWNSATDEMLATWLLGDASPYQVKAQRVSMDFIVPPVPGVPVVNPNPHPTGSYTVTWAPSIDGGFSGLSNYDLQRSLNGGTSWTTVGSPVAPSFADAVQMGQYLYRVRASDNAGNTSAYSAASAPVVVDPAPPAEPLSLQQYRADGVTPVAVGGSSPDGTLVFGAAVHDLGLLDGFEDSNVTLNPMWTVGAGTWAVSTDGSKVVHDGTGLDDFLSTPSTQSSGSWEYRFRFPTISNNANLRAGFYLFLDSAALGGNGYRALVSAGTTSTKTISLYRVDGASETRIAGANANWVPDTNFHLLRVNRGADGAFTLLLDGVVLGSAVENTYTSALSTGLRHLSTNGNTLRVDWIRMSSAPLARSNVKLQVEVKAVGTAFDGAGLVESPFLASGSTASVSVPVGSGSYHWRARTVDALGNTGAFSSFGANAETAADAVVLATTPPAPPTGLIAVAADSQVTLTWTGSTGATSYKVKSGTVHGGPYTEVPGLTSSPAVVTGLQNNTTYFFVVTAVGPGGESAPSNEASAMPQGVPAAPTALRVVGGNNQAFLMWTAPVGTVTYIVSRGSQSGGPYQPLASSIVPSGYIDPSAPNGGTYFYVVQAQSLAGTSGYSNEASVTPSGPPPVPANFTGTILSSNSIQWSWSDVSGESLYRLHDDAHNMVATIPPDVTTFTESNLQENTVYNRHVHAVYGVFEGGASNAMLRSTPVHDALATDFALTRPVATEIDVTVQAPLNLASGQTAVQIERSSDGTTWLVMKPFSKALTLKDFGLFPAANYSYRIRYQNADGVPSQTSPVVMAPPPPPPPAPTGVKATASLTSILQFTWDQIPGNTGYEVHDSNHVSQGTTTANVNVFTKTGLPENSQVTWHVHTLNPAGPGAASSPVSIFTGVHSPIGTDFTATLTAPNTIVITVIPLPNPTAGVTGCEIQRQNGAAWLTVKPFSNVYTFTDTPVASAATFVYRFRYQNGDGVAPSISSTKSVTTPPAVIASPQNFKGVGQSSASILWTWNEVPGETGFALKDDVGATIATVGAGVLSYLESGLSENQAYSRHLLALKGSASSADNAVASNFTLVHGATAADLMATPATMSSVNITLAEPPNPTVGATGIRVERSTDGTTWAVVPTLAHVYLLSDTGLRGSTAYQYRAQYLNGDGLPSAVSPVKTASTPAATVAPVAGLSAAGGNHQVTLTWTANSEPVLAGYLVYRSDASGGPYSKVSGALVTATTYVDSTATPGVTLYYVVRAQVTAGGEGANSNEASAAANPPPPTPIAVGITALSESSIRTLASFSQTATVTFEARDDANVVRASLGPIANGGEVQMLTETGLAENTLYTRHVDVIVDGQTSLPSNSVSAHTLVHQALTLDYTLVSNPQESSITINIVPPRNPAEGDTGVVIWKLFGCGSWGQLVELTGEYTYTDTNVFPGTSYAYMIQFKNADGVRGGFSGTQFGSGPAGVPLQFSGMPGTSSILWQWTYVSGASPYRLHDAAEALIANVPQASNFDPSYLEGSLLENTAYTRHVHAVVGGILGTPSPSATVTTTVHNPLISDFTVTALSATDVRITVVPPPNPTSGKTGCEIQRLIGNSWVVISTFAIPTYTFVDSGLTPGTVYSYRIRFRNATNLVTAPSPSQDVSTGPVTSPAATGFAGQALSPSSIQWSWNDYAGAEGYVIHDAQENITGSAPAGTLSFIETGLPENTPASRHLHAIVSGFATMPTTPVLRHTFVHDATSGDLSLQTISANTIRVNVLAPPQPVSGLTGVQIERSLDGSTWAEAKPFSNIYGVQDLGLNRSTTYLYRVTFRNGDGIVALPSPPQSADTLSIERPVITTLPKKTRNHTTGVQGIADPGVSILVYFNGAFDGSVTSTPGGTWSYTSQPKGEGTFQVTARAHLNSQETADSDSVAITVDVTAPSAPKGVRTTSYNNAIDVEWDPSSSPDVAGYQVYRRDANGTNWSLISGSNLVTGMKYRDSTAQNGNSYRFKVVAVDDCTND